MSRRWVGRARWAGPALWAGGLAVTGASLPLPCGGQNWQRTNYRGVPVSLTSGPALALALGLASGLPQPAAAVAAFAGSGCGALDDRVGSASDRGLRGHLQALRTGRVTTGVVKVFGLGAAGLASAVLLPGRRTPVQALLAGAVVAGSANLINLLDLRPGRALKAGLAGALVLRQPAAAGVAAALLPADLRERQMLGDTGANALGAVLGLAFVQHSGPRGTTLALLGLTWLTAASEVVSFSAVIEAVPALRALDRLGRQG